MIDVFLLDLLTLQVSPADHWDPAPGTKSSTSVEEMFRTMIAQRLAKGSKISLSVRYVAFLGKSLPCLGTWSGEDG